MVSIPYIITLACGIATCGYGIYLQKRTSEQKKAFYFLLGGIAILLLSAFI